MEFTYIDIAPIPVPYYVHRCPLHLLCICNLHIKFGNKYNWTHHCQENIFIYDDSFVSVIILNKLKFQ